MDQQGLGRVRPRPSLTPAPLSLPVCAHSPLPPAPLMHSRRTSGRCRRHQAQGPSHSRMEGHLHGLFFLVLPKPLPCLAVKNWSPFPGPPGSIPQYFVLASLVPWRRIVGNHPSPAMPRTLALCPHQVVSSLHRDNVPFPSSFCQMGP